jgi:transcriptional regulator with XRE-family HTH domain
MTSASASSTRRALTPGEQIHIIRKRRHVSAQTIADALGVHRNTVARWEAADNDAEPSVSQARVIAELLGCRIEDIAGAGGLALSGFALMLAA